MGQFLQMQFLITDGKTLFGTIHKGLKDYARKNGDINESVLNEGLMKMLGKLNMHIPFEAQYKRQVKGKKIYW